MVEVKEEKKEEKKSEFTSKLRENPYIVSTIVLGLATLILVTLTLSPSLTGNVISGSSAGQNLIDYLNTNVGGGVGYVSYEDLGNLYQIIVSYNGDNIPVYVTKDGKYFISSIQAITGQAVQQEQQTQATEVPKSDKPEVELFVMTHCPYGTQAEKGLIPVIETLGNKIDAEIRFVHYFMHGDREEQETYNQVCIREEQSSKFLTYLKCFLEDGDSSRCQNKVGIDKTKLNSCLQGKAKEYYASDSELSKSYDVQGSPTLVINGVIANSGRSPSAFLTAICSAFNTKASECSQQVSSENPSAGFGYSASSASPSSASCG